MIYYNFDLTVAYTRLKDFSSVTYAYQWLSLNLLERVMIFFPSLELMSAHIGPSLSAGCNVLVTKMVTVQNFEISSDI
jgi:hypothetical protein